MKNIIVVTGASSGMGKEFVAQIDRKEKVDEIWVIARREEKLKELQSLVNAKIVPIVLDLTNREKIKDVYKKKIDEEKPNVKVLACIAGWGRFAHFESVSADENISMIDTNLTSTVLMVNYTLDYMKEGSNIMILCSGSSVQPVPYINMYGATKAALLSFSRSLNRELKYRGIHVLAVSPLWVETEFFNRAINKNEKPVVINYGTIDSAEGVIKKAIKDLYSKKDVSKYAFHNKFQQALVKILPHSLIMSIWMKQQKLDGTPNIRR